MNPALRLVCLLLLTVLLSSLAACGGGPSAVNYYRDESTQMMDLYPQASITYATGLNNWSFSNQNLGIKFSIETDREYGFALTLVNKTSEPVVIGWGETFYINTAGRRYHMIHNGVPFWSPARDNRPTTVQPGQMISDVLQPARLVKQDGAWRLAPLTSGQIAQGDYPDTITILMPMRVLGVVQVHRFDFDIGDIEDIDEPYNPWYY